MELFVYCYDLKDDCAKPKSKDDLKKISFEMFKEEVQAVIRRVGSATFNCKNFFKDIKPPIDPECQACEHVCKQAPPPQPYGILCSACGLLVVSDFNAHKKQCHPPAETQVESPKCRSCKGPTLPFERGGKQMLNCKHCGDIYETPPPAEPPKIVEVRVEGYTDFSGTFHPEQRRF